MGNVTVEGLQRYKRRTCSKTFNAPTGTPLARLLLKGKWPEQTRASAHGLTVHRADEFMEVVPSAAFRWCHRFLAVSRDVKPASLSGVAEIEDVFPGVVRGPHGRRAHAAKRGRS